MDAELQKIKLEMDVQVKEERFENDETLLENLDYTHCIETTESNIKIETGDNGHHVLNEFSQEMLENCIDTTESNIKIETGDNDNHVLNEYSQEMFENLQTDANIYVSENADYHSQNNGNVDRLVEIIYIKQEIQDHQDQISDTNYPEDVSHFKNTEITTQRNEVAIKTEIDHSDFETVIYNNENSSIDVRNSYENFELKHETGSKRIEESDVKVENSNSFIYNFDGNLTRNELNCENTSSIIGMNLKKNKDSNIDKCDFKFGNTEFNNAKCSSSTGTMDNSVTVLTSGILDIGSGNNRLEDENNLQPSVLLKRPPDTLFINQGNQVHNSTHNTFHTDLSKHISSDQSQIGKSELPPKSLYNGRKTGTTYGLAQHLIHHDTDHPHQCNVCEEGCKTMYELRNHMTSHSTVMQHQSNKPEKVVKTKPKSHMCNVCDNGFKTAFALKCHMVRHKNEQSRLCNICEKVFKTRFQLKLHLISHSTERPHQCDICKKRFKGMRNLKGHMVRHSTERPHQCNLCGNAFKTTFGLRDHMICHTTETPYQCHICQKVFKAKSYLRRHMATHNTDKPHKCKDCEREFKTKRYLREHMITHETEKPHKCKDCHKEFHRLGLLKKHVACHSTERPFQCSICEKRFKSMRGLTEHMTSHSTEKPYQCDICKKRFKGMRGLSEHVIRHSTEKPYQCNICEKRFKTKSYFGEHMIRHDTELPY